MPFDEGVLTLLGFGSLASGSPTHPDLSLFPVRGLSLQPLADPRLPRGLLVEAYWAGRKRSSLVLAAPHSGFARLLHTPVMVLKEGGVARARYQ